MTRLAALNVCIESEPVFVHFSKGNKLPYDTTTLTYLPIRSVSGTVYGSKFSTSRASLLPSRFELTIKNQFVIKKL